ncbi:MAG: N-acetyltransferase [Marivirga sp.]|nr:N-acetyltransferase [Marivirga sp.]
MIIRQAAQRDQSALHDLLTQLGYPPAADRFIPKKMENYSADGYHLLVCEHESKTVGFISLHWFDTFHSEQKMGRITALCVSDHVRDQGVGGMLLKEAEKFLIMKGCYKVEVTTNFKRTRTHGFYLKNGYSEDSRRFIKLL